MLLTIDYKSMENSDILVARERNSMTFRFFSAMLHSFPDISSASVIEEKYVVNSADLTPHYFLNFSENFRQQQRRRRANRASEAFPYKTCAVVHQIC